MVGALLGSGFIMYYIDVLPSGSILLYLARRGIQEVSLILLSSHFAGWILWDLEHLYRIRHLPLMSE